MIFSSFLCKPIWNLVLILKEVIFFPAAGFFIVVTTVKQPSPSLNPVTQLGFNSSIPLSWLVVYLTALLLFKYVWDGNNKITPLFHTLSIPTMERTILSTMREHIVSEVSHWLIRLEVFSAFNSQYAVLFT